jgi:hypothetical protein
VWAETNAGEQTGDATTENANDRFVFDDVFAPGRNIEKRASQKESVCDP